MLGELARDVPGRRRMAGQIGQRGFALLDAAGFVELAEQAMVAGLVTVGEEGELAGLGDTSFAAGEGPAGEDAGERRHVGLRVAAGDAQRVQLEDLARQVFVEAALAPLSGNGARPERLGIVEIDQHGRMAGDGAQHVGEAAEHVRPDRLALEASGGGANRPTLRS